MVEHYRDKAIEEKGSVCENCGSTEDIEVHHQDKNRCNNDLDNLIVLCSDCHNEVHNGYPQKGTFLRELMLDTGITLPEPVYIDARAESEKRGIPPGAVIESWRDKAKRYEDMERFR